MFLKNIAESVQQIADAIAAVLGSNVTIVDEKLVRIAGTGPYQRKLAEQVPPRSVFARALESKTTILIENPGVDVYCLDCSLKESCLETYEICTPIIWQGQPIGVIAIFAEDKEQRQRLLGKEKQYKTFLQKMSELIAGKVGEHQLYEEIMTYNKELDIIIQHVNQGVICVSSTGRIMQINQEARKLLSLNDPINRIQGRHLGEIWPTALILKAIEKDKEYTDQEEQYPRAGQKRNFLSTIRLIKREQQVTCGVATFNDLEDMQKSIYRVTEKTDNWTFANIIGSSSSIKENKKKANKVAAYDSTVLITGESGTGKEIFARAIHNASQRSNYPFVAINCSAIPESLLESELFGYASGAFTGASSKGKPGKFELAHQGTIFLDEIGDMPLYLQAKLLRVLQEKKVNRVGGIEEIRVDVRILAASNRDLEYLIKQKMFREDLYYRLNVIPLRLTPLRERKEDIPVLLDYFLEQYNLRFHKRIKGFTPEAMRFMLEYSWPGNVRELENVIEYGINFCRGQEIGMDDISGRFDSSAISSSERMIEDAFRESSETGMALKELVREFEQKAISRLLDLYGWDEEGKKRAASKLDISRATLYRKLAD